MIAISKEYNINVLLATWAHNNQFKDYASTPHYEFAYNETNEIIKKVALTHDVSLYDFAKEMPIDKKYWFDGRHLNEEGVELKASLFAKHIHLNKLITD